MYSTDASVYKEMPLAVVYPENKNDIINLINYCRKSNLNIIPRGGGTSLAGQVVGKGIIVDISKKYNKIIEINEQEKWALVEPGVILSDLNRMLESKNLFFGPETSSANRVTMGGMVGNNASGLHLLVYGDTRSKLLSVKALLSDATEVVFEEISQQEFRKKLLLQNTEGAIYRKIDQILSSEVNRNEIKENCPSENVKKRNTGYAIEYLMNTEIFDSQSTEKFNLSKIIAGSEGTLAFITEIKIELSDLPPKNKALVCVHFNKLEDSFKANLIALKYSPAAVEIMDKTILDLTKGNIEQNKNRFFIKEDPAALMFVEFVNEDTKKITDICKEMENEMRKAGFGYHFEVVWGNDIKKVWNLRKAGLGVLSNMPGDARPVSLVEDTAVDVNVLPEYLAEFDGIMKKYNLTCVYHAHIGSGELHLRPVLNLKLKNDVELFHTVALEVAYLVKKFRGSLSGEHGDGRLRGEFLPLMFGDKVYGFFREIKNVFDPENIFNRGKIIDTPPMNSFLRYEPDKKTPEIKTYFDFSDVGGYMRAVEKCNGSADCRKSEFAGGTMCPSFQATRNEWNSTRARANTLREFISSSKKLNKFNHKEIYRILSTCLSCKACKSECPSNVDITKIKAEFLQHYYKSHIIPLRTRIIANFPVINNLLSIAPNLSNYLLKSAIGKFFARLLGFAKQRQIPEVNLSLTKSYSKIQNKSKNSVNGTVYLFNDEFTNYNDTDIGIKAILLLEKLGYDVKIIKHKYSGRTYLSKGLVKKAKKIINQNLLIFKDIISEKIPLIGIEPSAILTFRDESIDLAYPKLKETAKKMSKSCLLFDEFIVKEAEAGRIKPQQFTDKPKNIKIHGHCYQKALASVDTVKKMLSLPVNYQVVEIPSGCCGMAGAFGYEKENYDLSMKVGELVLFPEIRKTETETEIVASGTSCRHQIQHGTGRVAKHQIEVLFDALND